MGANVKKKLSVRLIFTETKKPLEIEPKVEPKDDVSEHNSVGAMDHDDGLSLDNYSADDTGTYVADKFWSLRIQLCTRVK